MRPQTKRYRYVYLITAVTALLTAAIVFIASSVQDGSTPTYNSQEDFAENEVPKEYISVYKQAGEDYDIPWTLLAAVHRVETVFSTMETLESPVGAIGHMQFMPCTFVGWNYPGCGGNGSTDIPERELTDPETINEYGGYGVDADGDGRADPYALEDAVYSAANFLASNGAAGGEVRPAIYQYNQADWYVDDILNYYNTYDEEVELVSLEENHLAEEGG
ncbi:Transglycosylase SLT domain-containing protein [Marinococcus luteus]|uniref:Transglycosylase SLT domain-containing protein n=1 Tax=Marinococcus luteus TaxID=1122204 RepID=A0A1H2SAZ4_9BACI|nr:lytic transglycosylase domain-containing protein [Marinococcus luteus]SDW28786.1 Transglycosylase SLT domain-containing protein [Marinococcus luteus]